jgi:hypothetical protein
MQKIRREMGCSSEDLIRWLPLAMGSYYSFTNLIIDGMPIYAHPKPLVEINALTKSSRKIALLQIPVMDISFSFAEELTINEQELLMNRFDLYTRRGGG